MLHSKMHLKGCRMDFTYINFRLLWCYNDRCWLRPLHLLHGLLALYCCTHHWVDFFGVKWVMREFLIRKRHLPSCCLKMNSGRHHFTNGQRSVAGIEHFHFVWWCHKQVEEQLNFLRYLYLTWVHEGSFVKLATFIFLCEGSWELHIWKLCKHATRLVFWTQSLKTSFWNHGHRRCYKRWFGSSAAMHRGVENRPKNRWSSSHRQMLSWH